MLRQDDKDPINFEVMDDEARADLYAENMNMTGIERVLKSIPKNVRSLEICIDCDEDIPLGRQKAYPGVTRCVPCQNIFDVRKSR